jgi:hypothetical protein
MCYILLDLFGREREVRVLEKKEKANENNRQF